MLLKIPDVLKSSSRAFVGKDNLTIHLHSVTQGADGSLRVRMAIEEPGMQDFFGNRLRMRVNNKMNNTQNTLPVLVDAEGREHVGMVINQTANANGGRILLNAELVYNSTAAPSHLLMRGQRIVFFNIPFTLKNVPI